MSSLYALTKEVEVLYVIRNYKDAEVTRSLAEDIIRRHWPKKGENPVAICCFTVEGSVVYCHDNILKINHRKKTISVIRRVPLHRAELEERKELCGKCREDCRKRIETLKRVLAGKSGGQ